MIITPPIRPIRKPRLSFHTSAADTSNSTTYTFSSQAIGTASPDRVVIVVFAVRDDSAGSPNYTSCTIDGQSMDLVVQRSATGTPQAFYQKRWPTGTTATFVVTLDQTCERAGIAVYSVDRLLRYSAFDTALGSSGSPSVVTGLDIPAGGFAIFSNVINTGGGSFTSTDVTEDTDFVLESTTAFFTGHRTNSTGVSETGLSYSIQGTAASFGQGVSWR